MEPLVELRSAAVTLGGTPVLRGIDFTLGTGELALVVGPNGSGKTTLLRVLATLLRPTGGALRLFGHEGTALRQQRPRIGYLGHTVMAYPDLSLAENLELVADLGGHPRSKIGRVLDIIGLSAAADLRVTEVSAGMQRRLDVGRLLMCAPDLLLLDEPTAGLDEDSRGLIAETVRAARARGAGAVVVSHEAALVDDPTAGYRIEAGALTSQ